MSNIAVFLLPKDKDKAESLLTDFMEEKKWGKGSITNNVISGTTVMFRFSDKTIHYRTGSAFNVCFFGVHYSKSQLEVLPDSREKLLTKLVEVALS